MSIKLDLHVHTESRERVFVTADDLRRSLREKGLDGIAVTNFFDISHALRLKEKVKEYIVIVGQEIWTKDGDIVGLGLKERIADFQSGQETIGHIHKQGGIAVAVHPFLHLGIGKKMASLSIDAVEAYNGAMGASLIHNYLAKKMAQDLNLPQLASTDTSDPKFIGRSYTEIMTDDRRSILEAIRLGDVKLFKRALPIPFIFILKNILKFQNLEPCSIHAVPCLMCGKALTMRLFRERFKCLDCGRIKKSRVACCNGHYICRECIVKRSLK